MGMLYTNTGCSFPRNLDLILSESTPIFLICSNLNISTTQTPMIRRRVNLNEQQEV